MSGAPTPSRREGCTPSASSPSPPLLGAVPGCRPGGALGPVYLVPVSGERMHPWPRKGRPEPPWRAAVCELQLTVPVHVPPDPATNDDNRQDDPDPWNVTSRARNSLRQRRRGGQNDIRD